MPGTLAALHQVLLVLYENSAVSTMTLPTAPVTLTVRPVFTVRPLALDLLLLRSGVGCGDVGENLLSS